ncbi:MAG: LysM peptidoglycan-binding domain-containing protein [Anaerolineae bacterium]
MMKYLLRLVLFLVVGGLLFGFVGDVSASTAYAAGGGWDILGQHTVRMGETLYCIGRAYGVDPWAIALQNNLAQPSRIYSGMVLAIPDVPAELPLGPVCAPQFGALAAAPMPSQPATSEPAPATAAPATCGGCACRWYYVIAAGDTLTRISLRYGRDLWTIARCNCIQNVNFIRAGDCLCIP